MGRSQPLWAIYIMLHHPPWEYFFPLHPIWISPVETCNRSINASWNLLYLPTCIYFAGKYRQRHGMTTQWQAPETLKAQWAPERLVTPGVSNILGRVKCICSLVLIRGDLASHLAHPNIYWNLHSIHVTKWCFPPATLVVKESQG